MGRVGGGGLGPLGLALNYLPIPTKIQQSVGDGPWLRVHSARITIPKIGGQRGLWRCGGGGWAPWARMKNFSTIRAVGGRWAVGRVPCG